MIHDELEGKKLKRLLLETQELYRAGVEQLKEKSDKCDRQEEELTSLRSKLQEVRSDFSSISSQMLRQSSDRDYHSKSIILELDELRSKKEIYETELKKLDAKYKASSEQFEIDLAASRDRFLHLLDEKTKMESEVLEVKIEKREILNQLQLKDHKLNEANTILQSYLHELGIFKKNLNLNEGDMTQIQQLTDTISENDHTIKVLKEQLRDFEKTESDLRQENDNLKDKVDIYEAERLQKDNETINQQTLQQLSYIILSKDKTLSLDNTSKTLIKQVFGENCTKLMENYEELIKNLQSDKQRLKDRLNYECEQRIQILLENKELLEVIYNLDPNNGDVGDKIQDITTEISNVKGQINNDIMSSPKHYHNVFSFRESEEKLKRKFNQQMIESKETERLKAALDLQKSEKHRALAEKEQYREDLAQSILIIAELKEKIGILEGTAQNQDLIGFLQCEAAAFEDVYHENQIENDSFSEL